MDTLLFLITLFMAIILGGVALVVAAGAIFVLFITIKEVIDYVTNRQPMVVLSIWISK